MVPSLFIMAVWYNWDIFIYQKSQELMCDDPQLPEPLARMRQKLDGSEEDERLYQLIENFCQQGSNKIKRSRAFAFLLAEIKKLPLKKPLEYHPEYEDILQETWLEVYQKICTEFDPQGENLRNSLTLWINEKLRLKYKVIDLFSTGKKQKDTGKPKTGKQELNELIRQKPISLDAPASGGVDDSKPSTLEENIAAPDSDPMEQMLQQEEQERQQKLKKAIGELNCPSKKYPQLTCGEIAKRHLLKQPPDTIAQIARDLKIPYQTINSHWKRNCKPLLADIWKQFNPGE